MKDTHISREEDKREVKIKESENATKSKVEGQFKNDELTIRDKELPQKEKLNEIKEKESADKEKLFKIR